MRIMGVKVLPIAVAALAVYMIGFVIYGLLFGEQYQTWSGIDTKEAEAHMWKMGLGWIMPVALSIGIANLIRTRNIKEISTGAVIGAKVGLFLILACQLYNFVYSTEPWMLLALDSFHIILISITAGAILSAMKVAE